MTQYEREIREQPAALSRLYEARGTLEGVARAIKEFEPKFVVIAARGSSDNAARYGQYLFGVRQRHCVALALPSLLTFYGTAPSMKDALVIGISQSGASPDIVSVVREARAQGAMTLALTNEGESALGKTAEHCALLLADKEHAVAATKTYTNQVFALAMLSAALTSDEQSWRDLGQVPEYVERVLEQSDAIRGLAQRLAAAGRSKCFVLGRGYNYSTAFEVALKLKETSLLLADAYSSADLMHGPVALLDQDSSVLLFSPSGPAAGETPDLVANLEARGAHLVLATDRGDLAAQVQDRIQLPSGMPEWVSPIASTVSGQILGLHWAQARGYDPDRPRGLQKVTLTH